MEAKFPILRIFFELCGPDLISKVAFRHSFIKIEFIVLRESE